jgi:type IV pilus assembly protein PilM
MVFSLFSQKNRIINLVINDHSIRYLELKQVAPPIVQRWSERFLPPGIVSDGKIKDRVSLSNILEECVDEWKIQRRKVRFIVPDPLVIIRKVSVPVEIQNDEIKGYLYLELGSTIHLPFEEPVFDFHLLGNTDKTKDLLLFAAPEHHLMDYANLLSSVKLNPIAADISPLALYRIHHQQSNSNDNGAVFTVQFDLTSVNFCIFNGSIPLVMRQFPLDFEIEDWAVKQKPGSSMNFEFIGNEESLTYKIDEIYREINKLLDFYKYSLPEKKSDVTMFLLNGDHPMLKELSAGVNERFEMPVTLLSSEANSKVKTGSLPASILLSLGLALKEVQ